MKEIMLSFLLGATVGIGMLLCPQVRHFVDKTSKKIEKKIQKLKEKTEETSD